MSRANYLEEDIIGIIPRTGYRFSDLDGIARVDGIVQNSSAGQEDKMFARREKTEKKLAKIRAAGFYLIVKRECEFRGEFKEHAEIDICLSDTPLIANEPLNPRNAFVGGRTNATKLYYKCKSGEKIKYVDICSLYPKINKYYKVHVGHANIKLRSEPKNRYKAVKNLMREVRRI